MAQSSQTISPNLLRNFNPYSILKPEKTSPGPHIDKLIDIDDSALNTEASGSLSDQKSNYDLIDLIQNLYVTPNDVKIVNTDKKSNEVNVTEANYKDFFDKLELNEKIDRVSKEFEVGNIKPKILVPKIDLNDIVEHTQEDFKNKVPLVQADKSKIYTNNVIDSDSEDLIYEILSEKIMEKIILKEMKESISNTEPIKEYQFPNLKVLNPPNIDLETPKNSIQETKYSKKSPDTNTETPEASNSKLNNIDLNMNKNKIINLNENELINNKINFEVIPHKRNPKVFKKKCEIRPEVETRNYTKGADFKEISAVLPQIMSRISSRRTYLEQKEVNSGKKKYRREDNTEKEEEVLDLKTMRLDCEKYANVLRKEVECNPVILMADCNKQRLKAFQQGKMFQKFVMGENTGKPL